MALHPTIRPPPHPPRTPATLPQVNHATTEASFHAPPSWLLDSAASHHDISNLANLSLHYPYDGTDEIVIGDGSLGPSYYSHWFSPSPHPTYSLTPQNVPCVPSMHKYIISISPLCLDNNITIVFSPTSFCVKDQVMGAPLLTG